MNAVGACTPAHRELDTAAVQRARVYVDTLDACLKEPGMSRPHFLLERTSSDCTPNVTPISYPRLLTRYMRVCAFRYVPALLGPR